MSFFKTIITAPSLRLFFGWILISTLLNLGWEIMHLPLYEIPLPQLVFGSKILAALHCTVGDAMISASLYVITSILLRNGRWLDYATWRGLVLYTVMGLLYTVYSEWHNVQVLKTWSYGVWMPTLWDIGVSPLLQWLVLPFLTLIVLRKYGYVAISKSI